MVKIKFTLAIVVAAVAFSIFGVPLLAQQMSQGASQPPAKAKDASEPEQSQMQFYADEQFNIEGTDTIIMLGNVVLHHNGAVVVCDSAVRYSESKFDCFGKVIINQDSTYIYCNKATYDRDENLAQVFDKMIKIVSGSSVLYTYNFSFNTLDSIGRYWGGGTMLQDSNRMESDRGWYHTGRNDIYAAGHVQMTDPDYELISDSVRYNTNEQVAEFYNRTYIWNSDGDILSAKAGKYYNLTREYDFTSDAYVQTSTRELWADTLTYNSVSGDAVARRNIQMLDDEQQILAFGDYGEWYGESQEGLLTLDPVVAGFDREAPEDTVFMRADSMFLFSIPWDWEWGSTPADIKGNTGMPVADTVSTFPGFDENFEGLPETTPVISTQEVDDELLLNDDEIREFEMIVSDSISIDSMGHEIINEVDILSISDRLLLPDSILNDSVNIEIVTDTLRNAEDVPVDYIINLTDFERTPPENIDADSISTARDSLITDSLNFSDTLVNGVSDSLDFTDTLDVVDHEFLISPNDSLPFIPADSLVIARDTTPEPEVEHDSLQRMVKAYRNVRIWRRDFQGVCDSMVGFNKDSTVHMYIEPVLWNEENQITASVIDIYTKNKELDRAEFTGNPLMAAEVTAGLKYNQIAGQRMESFFKNNEIYRHFVDGNAQTYYYKVEDGDTEPSTFGIINSATITFLIEDQEVTRMNWATTPDYVAFPIDQIPAKTEEFLPDFKWEAERRPERSDVITRTIRPSERMRYMGISRPHFPMTRKIENHKKQLIERREWEERYELLPQSAIEWLRKIGVGQ